MKKLFLYVMLGGLVVASTTSCKKFLDVNTSPNSATVSTPELILPQAIVRSASLVVSFSSFGSGLVGYLANAGGVSGWGSFISYNYTTGDFSGLFSSIYKANEDLEQVVLLSTSDEKYKAFRAAAKIMQVYNFQSLVDTYNDVPYSEALTGAKNLQPKYDKAEDIYKALADSLDVAVALLNSGATSTDFKNADPLFAGSIANWVRFANTLKLRLIIRGGSKVSFTNTTFDPAGFLTDDAIVNPGYTQVDGKQNPFYSSWAYSAAGTAAGGASQRIPTPYYLSFLNGTKILDNGRANLFFGKGVNTPKNQLGYQQSDAEKGISPSVWYKATGSTNSSTNFANKGILKSPDMGMPIMLAAESFFLRAQGNLEGLAVGGTLESNYYSGIYQSFKYLEKDGKGAVTTATVKADTATYMSDNLLSRLVNISLAATPEEQLEAIVTQQYIAYNMTFGHQAWYEFQRTGYPVITTPNSEANKNFTFVSLTSESTAPDRLPTRVLYPTSEFSYNTANVPTVDKYSSKIFWAK